MADWDGLVQDVQGQDVVLIMFGSYKPLPLAEIITEEEATVLLISW